MALFGRNTQEEQAQETAAPEKAASRQKKSAAQALVSGVETHKVLHSPRITEKAALQGEKGVYVFNVYSRATKNEVKKAIMKQYKVTPRKVCVVRVPGKRTFYRGVRGRRSGGKKAYVYLKKGESINIV